MEIENKCEYGWHDGGCCCNCENQMELRSHPWNSEFGKGPISKTCGYACILGHNETGYGIFFDSKHGYCEMHYPRKTKKVDEFQGEERS